MNTQICNILGLSLMLSSIGGSWRWKDWKAVKRIDDWPPFTFVWVKVNRSISLAPIFPMHSPPNYSFPFPSLLFPSITVKPNASYLFHFISIYDHDNAMGWQTGTRKWINISFIKLNGLQDGKSKWRRKDFTVKIKNIYIWKTSRRFHLFLHSCWNIWWSATLKEEAFQKRENL